MRYTAMPRNILLFSDGTGNSAAKLAKTNVWRLYQSVDLSDPDRQIAYYDDGVGTSSFKPLALIGGAFGWGLKRNVVDLYTFLCRNYREGDRIFCFGFSRGAFTARVLTGLILNEGIVSADKKRSFHARAKTAFRAYKRKRYHSALRLEVIGRALRDLVVGDKDYQAVWERAPKPPVAFLGIWDTVAAYGLPIDELTRALAFVWPLTPQDREPHPSAQRICHAVALDDERNTFHPMLFNEASLPENQRTTNIDQERVTQVWFAGMHSNVGGGYPDDALSGVSLDWMMEQAEKAGILLKPSVRQMVKAEANPLGRLYDSRRGLGGFYRYLPRKLSFLTNDQFDKNKPCFIDRPKIHESVFQRIAKGVEQYAPIGLTARYAVVTADGSIVDHYVEDGTQAEGRSNAQERIWNLVWWKRITYFLSVILAGALLIFPFWRGKTEACENIACSVAPLIDAAGAFLPDFLSQWISSFRSHPGSFLALAISFSVLLWWGGKLQDKIFDRMRALWQPALDQPNTPSAIAPLPKDWLYWFRTRSLYQFFFRCMKRIVLPTVFGLATLWIISGMLSRATFKMLSAAGRVCVAPVGGEPGKFDACSVCSATGVSVKEGNRYRITLRAVGNRQWKDRTIVTGVGGFDRAKLGWLHLPFWFFRRDLEERWFTPIARIGKRGNDEYPLHPVNGSIPDEHTTELVAEITARRDGPLFLFVNDAVLPVGDSWQRLYRNNEGLGRVTVEELPDE